MWPVDQYLLGNKSILLDAFICINFFSFFFRHKLSKCVDNHRG